MTCSLKIKIMHTERERVGEEKRPAMSTWRERGEGNGGGKGKSKRKQESKGVILNF